MKMNDKEIDINELIKNLYDDKGMIKMCGNGIYLSDNDIEVLKKYNIDYHNYSSVGSLIFDIEEILNEEVELDDLEDLSKRLSELNYYNNTNK